MSGRIGDLLPVPSLRPYLHDQNAPLTAQYTWTMLHLLPADATRNLGARAFRTAQHEFWAARGLQLAATRRDIQTGLAFLAAVGAIDPSARGFDEGTGQR
ncbi:hypothetical protein [Microbacterium sp. NPDC056569]|uniref:hypothetical protein n=1 Tax=Microbacterium sp. NPDC056569 TaxID=3345867 RepID=UPI00367008A0